MQQMMEPQATVVTQGGSSIGQARAEAYNGPKARVAVTRFTDKTAKGWYTGEIGDSMAFMLSTSLFHTNRFIVLDRQTVDDVIGEQDFGASGRVKKETAAKIGEIEGAELLVKGAVTEFEPHNAGVGGGVGSGRRGWGEIAAGVGAMFQKAHIAIEIQVIDANTSRLVAASRVEGNCPKMSIGGAVFGDHLGAGLGAYKNTSTEKAIRAAIDAAANFIATQTPAQYYH